MSVVEGQRPSLTRGGDNAKATVPVVPQDAAEVTSNTDVTRDSFVVWFRGLWAGDAP